jgi:hypothetical protein
MRSRVRVEVMPMPDFAGDFAKAMLFLANLVV